MMSRVSERNSAKPVNSGGSGQRARRDLNVGCASQCSLQDVQSDTHSMKELRRNPRSIHSASPDELSIHVGESV